MMIFKVLVRDNDKSEERYFTDEQSARDFAKYYGNVIVYKISPCVNNNNQITWWKIETI